MDEKLIVSYAPHIRTERGMPALMRDVLIALIPAFLVGIYAFGVRALLHTLICAISCVAFEYLWCIFMKKEPTVLDCSAAITGVLLAFNMPASAPLWLGIVGSLFAIIIVKCFFGGLGHNFMNPALAARAFLLSCWPVFMTTWTNPVYGSFFETGSISSATPLVADAGAYTYLDLFLGNSAGCIGEVSALALLIGFLYLLVRKVITWHISVIYIGVVFVLSYLFGADGVYQILSGGLFLGAIFMATDYTTSPMTIKGQVLYAVILGILTVIIRIFGNLPEGVSYSILVMNVVTPLIDKFTKNKRYGGKANG